jgi:ribosomal protein S18 acetylase RimI-like enzyme
MNIIIKEATAADAELIADMSRKTFYETFIADNSKEDMDKFMNEQFTKEALMAEVGAAGNFFLLAYVDEEPAGYARLRDAEAGELPDSIELARIYNDPKMIGKGVGKALMDACIAKAKELNKQTIWLGVWEKNDRAIRFYEKAGFEKFNEHGFLLGNDLQTDWLMKKHLADE